MAGYRALFAQLQNDGQWVQRGGEADTADMDKAFEESVRSRDLAVAVVKLLSEWCVSLGRLNARDLWLMLERDKGARDTSAEEVQNLLDMLVHPLVRAVDGDPDKGFAPSSKPAVTHMRL